MKKLISMALCLALLANSGSALFAYDNRDKAFEKNMKKPAKKKKK